MLVTKQILAFLLAAALMAGGTVRGIAAVGPCAPQHHDNAQAAGHANSSHHDHGDAHAHHHPEKKQDTDHKSCLECCGICVTATNSTAVTVSASIYRFASTISYSLESGVWLGQIVVVDPGIPKRIV
jgi:hypothetical protein